MPSSLHVVGIAGSLREGSYNRALLQACVELAPEGTDVEPFDALGEVPLYRAELDTDGQRPAVVDDLKRRIAEADAVLISTPEYNWSVPGVLKNAIDWASRPAFRSPFAGTPVGMMGASGGPVGTARAQSHLREVLAGMAALAFPHPGVAVGGMRERIVDGRLVRDEDREFLAGYLRDFAAFVRG